ncbi:LysM peptidoglycan-binding domain-containing protein [Thalassorhabdus alkalitolerans]|uniref:LysM peptidoglycan-binding domain-containing protein n=1 Tax=Thalassorhabdus alkalitolerans TaxID=2282697 RepID=A0ABW0YGQ4_9BACI
MRKSTRILAPVLASGVVFGVSGFSAHAATVTVEPGDTLWSIAQAERVSVSDLQAINNGLDPYNLQPGTMINLNEQSDSTGSHTVQEGETFYSIASQYEGVSAQQLMEKNSDLDPYNLQPGTTVLIENDSESARETADQVVTHLQSQDMEAVSSYIHPDDGVRFSPYAFVDQENDQVFSSEEVENLWHDETEYLWGNYDGSGHPIEYTFSEYYEEFVYNRDYAHAEEVAVDERQGPGNTIDNTGDVYPDATVVEYHFPSSGEYQGMDWDSLRLAMVQENGEWYVVGIINDEWTI